MRAAPLSQPVFGSPRSWAPAWGLLAGLGGIAWLLVARYAHQMGNGPGTMGMAPIVFMGMWVAMMAAMMLPAIGPMAAMTSAGTGATRASGTARRLGDAVSFGAGFLVPWAVYGVAALAAAGGANRLAEGSLSASKWVGVAILVVAAAYQLTGFKLRALEHCRMPMPAHHAGRAGGSIAAGIRDGAVCVGCCWALMATFIALGVMNVGLMVGLAVLILGEKVLPRPRLVAAVGALALLALAVAAAVHPGVLSGLQVGSGMKAMQGVGSGMGGM